MTLSLENLHSVVNKKHGTQTVLTYAQSFAPSLKKFVKRLILWATYNFIFLVLSWYLL